ncbi:MAG: gliding motility-associated C-terminal domain-containing protein [Muribaculaceae bacterium]|nr:gliding motility-associated C-terminal domain-containing protein [Muribaculaceae bacterium]
MHVRAGLTFSGSGAQVIEIKPEASTGLEAIYVLTNTEGVQVTSNYPSPWMAFGSMGGAYAEEIAAAGSTLTLDNGDTGILMTDDSGRQHCFWIVDYSAHELILDALSAVPEDGNCERTTLILAGHAEPIVYYTITGRREVLSRELELEYDTQVFDEGAFDYVSGKTKLTLEGVSTRVGVTAPLCDTYFTLTGDRFLRKWGREETVTSDLFLTSAVAAETRAEQTERENDNEQKDDTAGSFGGSAPCEIAFTAATSDKVIFREWQISTTPEFEILQNSFNEDSFTYTFTDKGSFYVRFVANNADGTCEQLGTVYEIFIGESRLDIPNAFSPGASPGVNDEWKVSYRSLIDFECHIFNRWGTEVFSFTDPSQGWDGKFRGKLVPAGVYYYVIRAKGADGVEYKRSGDINIINFRDSQGSSSSGNGSVESEE